MSSTKASIFDQGTGIASAVIQQERLRAPAVRVGHMDTDETMSRLATRREAHTRDNSAIGVTKGGLKAAAATAEVVATEKRATKPAATDAAEPDGEFASFMADEHPTAAVSAATATATRTPVASALCKTRKQKTNAHASEPIHGNPTAAPASMHHKRFKNRMIAHAREGSRENPTAVQHDADTTAVAAPEVIAPSPGTEGGDNGAIDRAGPTSVQHDADIAAVATSRVIAPSPDTEFGDDGDIPRPGAVAVSQLAGITVARPRRADETVVSGYSNTVSGTESSTTRQHDLVVAAELAPDEPGGVDIESRVNTRVRQLRDQTVQADVMIAPAEAEPEKQAGTQRECKPCGISWKWWLGIVLLLAAAGVGTGLVLTLMPDDNVNVNVNPTPSPTSNPTPSPTFSRSQIISQRLEGVLGGSSVHHRTFWWLVDDDPAMLNEITTSLYELADRYAAAFLYFAMNGDNWSETLNFMSNSSICEWNNINNNVTNLMIATNEQSVDKGIFCDEQGQVTVISLSENNLNGNFPVELIKLLANLTHLSFDKNNLTGQIPEEIGSLSSLQVLDLGMNQLSGTIPESLYLLTAIDTLFLNDNTELQGTISAAIGGLGQLNHISFSKCGLSGTIPTEVGNLQSLQNLGFSHNQLSGRIPTEVVKLEGLRLLKLGANKFTGTIPTEVGNFQHLQGLELSNNQLTGTIPTELGYLMLLENLHLGGNKLNGAIPTEVGNLQLLRSLDLSYNQLTRKIPTEIGKLKLLNDLQLHGNQITGKIPTEVWHLEVSSRFWVIRQKLLGVVGDALLDVSSVQFQALDWLVNIDPAMLPELSTPLRTFVERYVVALLHFAMNGKYWNSQMSFLSSSSICEWNYGYDGVFCNEGAQVTSINLWDNKLMGTIPTEVGNLQHLQSLDLGYNQLTGTIPTEVGNLHALQRLHLERNELTGTIPMETGNLYQLVSASFEGNLLNGTMPLGVCLIQKRNSMTLSADCHSTSAPHVECNCCGC